MALLSRRLVVAAIVGLALAHTVLAIGADSAAALPFLHGEGTAIADDRGQPVLLRGCDLGNWFLLEPWMLGITGHGLHDQAGIENALSKRFGEGEKQHLLDLYRENWITPRDFDRLKSWNFNVVRLPFHCDLLLDKAHPGELKPDAFHWLDHAIEMARQAGIYVILDLHGAPGGQSIDSPTGESGRNHFWTPENRRLGAMLWQKIAQHYAAEPTVAAYDLLNEPYGTMNGENHDDDLIGAMDQMIHAVRQVDEKHLIFCAGSFRGIEGYGSPQSHGWKNVGFTEHFYPGLFGGIPSLETHAEFIGANMAGRADLLKHWEAPYFVGEFNVVLAQAGGAAMMRRYYDVFARYGWAGTLWSYKLLKQEGGAGPSPWYMVTNRERLDPPDFFVDSVPKLEAYCRALGTMELAEADDLHAALTSQEPPSLKLGSYTPILLPEKRISLPGWSDKDIGDAYPRGGHTVADQRVRVFGGGRDIYGANDEFHLVSRPAAGDFDLKADVGLPEPTHIYAKAGLMFRGSSASDAPVVMMNLKPDGQCYFACRRAPGDKLTEEQLRFEAGASTLQLSRHSASFEATVFDKGGAKLASKTIALPELGGGEAGLFVLSHDAMLLSEASFGRVEFKDQNTVAAAR